MKKPSLKWTPQKIHNKSASYDWQVDYAEEVHNGSVSLGGLRKLPRPWVYEAISQYIDIVENMKLIYETTGNIDLAFADTVWDLQRAFTNAIEAEIYYWPNVTIRENGDVVESPRDIVDTGALRDSLVVEF
ncbi:MAG: hypothetical protein ACRCYP_02185 [Alphaproteobacteria bacterium]